MVSVEPKRSTVVNKCCYVWKNSGNVADNNRNHIKIRQIMAIKQMNTINMRYIRYFLQSNITYLKTQGQGVIPGIDRASILNMFLPLPPLAEQKRIVEKLEQLLPLCDHLK